MITIKTESIYNRSDWYQAQCVIGQKVYTAWNSKRDVAVFDVLQDLKRDGVLV